MELLIEDENPSILRLVDFEDPHGSIAESLSFRDKTANFQYLRFKNSSFFKSKMEPEKYEEQLQKLKSQIKKSILFEDERGKYTFSGLANFLSLKTRLPVVNKVKYPEFNKLPWVKEPIHKPYPYQTISEEKLIEIKHGGIELATGTGKSLILLFLLRNMGLKSIVMTPSTNLSQKLYEDLVYHLGKKYVGAFFDGKKESKKLITVANAQSLTRIEKDTEHYNNLSKAKVFAADECHTTPATTFEKVCSGVASKAPYRFFLSATQTRGDGKTLTLDGITGPIVYKKNVKEAVDEGYLAKPSFRIVKEKSESSFYHSDAAEMNRKHLLHNPRVVVQVAKLANLAANAKMPVLILIDEIEQFNSLLPYLRHKVGFAHGTLTKENIKYVPEEYKKSNVSKLVEDFNNGHIPILIGTSCISTGTDLKPVKFLVYWQGGTSEIQVKQAVGRGTRKFPGKSGVTVVDFDIENVDIIHRHCEVRKEIYQELYPDVREM